MPYRFAVHVRTTGKEIGRYRTKSGAEMAAERVSMTDEVYLQVWSLDEFGQQDMVVSKFAYGRRQPMFWREMG